MQSEAILFTGVDQVAVGTVEIPDPGPGQVLIESAFSCISPGTELRTLAGKQAGAAPWPLIPGYSMTGHVLAAGPGSNLAPGTAVYCNGTQQADVGLTWGGHVRHVVADASRVFPLPPGVALREAAMAHLAGIAYHGVRRARPQPHEEVVVIGLGAIGQLAARLHKLAGARVTAVDLVAARVDRAVQAGLRGVLVEGDLVASVRGHLPDGADVVVDVTGAPAVFPKSVQLARDLDWGDAPVTGARLLVQGSYADDFPVPYQESFRRELTILLTRDNQPRDIRTVLGFLQDGRLQVGDLMTDAEVESAPAVYADLQDRQGDLVTAVFNW